MMEKLSDNQRKRIDDFDRNYEEILENIEKAKIKAGRKDEVILLAATKTVEPYLINHAINKGIKFIGENRVQEFLSKYDNLNLNGVKRHFIGHLQTNKVRQIADKVDMIESVDSLKLLKEISARCSLLNKTMDVLIEINVANEKSKSGINPENLEEFVENASKTENINIRGLMAVPPICETFFQKITNFEKIYKIYLDINKKIINNNSMNFLSMGMSNDYQEAIQCNANIVRIGSSLFGQRVY